MSSLVGRHFCLTIQNPVEQFDCDLLNDLCNQKLEYFVGQLETSTFGTVHFQCYAEFSGTVRGSLFAKWADYEPTLLSLDSFSADEPFAWCSNIHVELRKGSRESARDYCRQRIYEGKDKGFLDGPWEWGVFAAKKPGKRTDLEGVITALSAGKSLRDIVREHPETYARYSAGVHKLESFLAPRVCRDVRSWVLWGPTGVGKSHFVYETFGLENVYCVPNEAPLWFDGYGGEPVIFFEEFGSNVDFKTLLKIMDVYPGSFPVKGAFVASRWFRVIFTGNSDFTRSWPPELLRRIGVSASDPVGNVRHCRGRGLGFPTAAEVGGAGGFSLEREQWSGAGAGAVPAAVVPVEPLPAVVAAGVAVVEEILPSFAVFDDGVVRES